MSLEDDEDSSFQVKLTSKKEFSQEKNSFSAIVNTHSVSLDECQEPPNTNKTQSNSLKV